MSWSSASRSIPSSPSRSTSPFSCCSYGCWTIYDDRDGYHQSPDELTLESIEEQKEYAMLIRDKDDPMRKHNNRFGSNTARYAGFSKFNIQSHPEITWKDAKEYLNDYVYIHHKTEIDDDLDISKKNRYGLHDRNSWFRTKNNKSTLCKKKTWDVIDILESKCIKKQLLKRNRWIYDEKVFIYTLPITESVFEKTKPEIKIDKVLAHKKAKELRWMMIDNINYDTNLIHVSTYGINFTPYGVFKYAEIPAGSSRLNSSINVVYNTKYNKSRQSANTSHNDLDFQKEIDICAINPNNETYYSYNIHKGYDQRNYNINLPHCTSKILHVNVDLGKDMQITAVSTMGRVHRLHARTEYDDDFWLDRFTDRCYTTKQIKFVREKESHFVNSFDLLYRKNGSKKWISLGTIQGNNDRLTEIMTKLDITARYLRFIPVTYNRSPSFQIGVFGKPIMEEVKSKQVASKQAAIKQAASKQAAIKQAAIKQAAIKQAASNQVESNQAAIKQVVSNQVVNNQVESKQDIFMQESIKFVDYQVEYPYKHDFYLKSKKCKWRSRSNQIRINRKRKDIMCDLHDGLDLYYNELSGEDQYLYDQDFY